jgi:hypothetical protein
MSWAKPAADTVYGVTVSNVKVAGVARSFSYTVTVYDPAVAGAGEVSPTIIGSTTPSTTTASHYTFDAVPGATGYQWHALTLANYALNDGAESGSGNFTVATTAGYPVVEGDAVASGAASFHLAHVQPTDQSLTLKQPFYIGSGASLSFASRLGYTASGQVALAELSLDEGNSWTALFSQTGSGGAGDSGFNTRTVSLAPYAGRTGLLRFRYAFVGGSYYPQSSKGVGWYLDNIGLSGVSAVQAGSATSITSNAFDFTPTAAGSLLLQVRPGMYGYYSDWSTAKQVNAVAGSGVSDADRLMNWAEKQYSQWFSPAASSFPLDVYTVRSYPGGIYLGVANGEVYVYGPPFGPTILDVGKLADFLAICGC